jgi:hypothetical protein
MLKRKNKKVYIVWECIVVEVVFLRLILFSVGSCCCQVLVLINLLIRRNTLFSRVCQCNQCYPIWKLFILDLLCIIIFVSSLLVDVLWTLEKPGIHLFCHGLMLNCVPNH